MTDESPVIKALGEPDGTRRRDRLSHVVIRERHGEYRLTPADSKALYEAMLAVGNQPVFDGLLFRVSWRLLAVAPAYPPLKKMAEFMIGQPEMLCRGDAFQHLLFAYPDERATLVAQYSDDPDPYVQDAIARHYAAGRPRDAIRHWERAAETTPLSHELSETLPVCLAEYGDESDLLRWEQYDREAGGNTLQGTASALMREKQAKEG
ncbi:MAG: hypothetical protein FIB01_07470 [Gemmatimonadetes bacterium]|nr:hypothetical protein [Gemmatimonadota bacterium]